MRSDRRFKDTPPRVEAFGFTCCCDPLVSALRCAQRKKATLWLQLFSSVSLAAEYSVHAN